MSLELKLYTYTLKLSITIQIASLIYLKLLIIFEGLSVHWKKMFTAFVDVDKIYI